MSAAVMKTVALSLFTVLLFSAPAAPSEPLSTERRVHGVITSIEPSTLTIASSHRTVTARIDAARTKVSLQGKPAKLADLKLTAHAKGEVCLDDVWLAIDAH